MQLTAGVRLGPYEIVSLLGVGGMGEVYRARDTELARDVAIEVLPAPVAQDPNRLLRFRRESQLLASLNHPNIAGIHGLVEGDGVRGLVLELVDGPTLAELLTPVSSGGPSPLSLHETLHIARQIADALEAAHEKGVVHRDGEPANIKITPARAVKVLDFGLAKATAPESSAGDLAHSPTVTADGTRAGVILGTAADMSPEQARGRDVDKRTDIWAFGCVLYQILARRPVHRGDTVSDTIAAVLVAEPDWQALPAETPASVRRLLHRCLEKEPTRRLRDIGDARIELEDEAVERATARPGDNTASNRDARSARRPSRWWIAACIVAAVGVGWLLPRRPASTLENPIARARFSHLTHFDGAEQSAAISPDGRFVAYRGDANGPLDVWLTQVGSGRFENRTQGTDDEFSKDTPSVGFSGDGSSIWLSGGPNRRLRLMPLLGGTPRAFLVEGAVTVAWSPNATRIVYHTLDDGDPLFVAEANGANAREIHRGEKGNHNHFPTWSRDGRLIYFVSGTPDTREMDLWRVAVDGGTPERLTDHSSDVGYPTPLDDHRLLYVAKDRDGSGPWLFELDVDRRLIRRVSFGLERYTSVASTTDGRRLVATVANPTAGLWVVPILDRPAEERDVKPYPIPAVNASAPRFGPTAFFYLSSQGAGSGLWRFQDGQTLEIWKGTESSLSIPPGVSHDGKRVAIPVRRDGQLRLHVLSADGAVLQPVAGTLDVRGSACWSPDGKWIATGAKDSAGAGLFKVPVDGGSPVRLFSGTALNPVWSPDDRLIVFAGANVSTSSPLLAVDPQGTRVDIPPISVPREGERARFTPDGHALIYGQGLLRAQDFWLLDLSTNKTRQLTQLNGRDAMRTFDITPDGKQIVFDRLRDNSDVVLIDLPK